MISLSIAMGLLLITAKQIKMDEIRSKQRKSILDVVINNYLANLSLVKFCTLNFLKVRD